MNISLLRSSQIRRQREGYKHFVPKGTMNSISEPRTQISVSTNIRIIH
jgi:hypothetical protein